MYSSLLASTIILGLNSGTLKATYDIALLSYKITSYLFAKSTSKDCQLKTILVEAEPQEDFLVISLC